jgi:hypothetical protein
MFCVEMLETVTDWRLVWAIVREENEQHVMQLKTIRREVSHNTFTQ